MDIQIDVDDFSICQHQGEEEYDLCFIDKERSLERLVRRALETPFSYIGRHVIDGTGSYNHNYDFGNPIYSKLSEAVTLNLISSINKDSEIAVGKIGNEISILSIDTAYYNFNEVNVRVEYSINGTVQTTNSNISLWYPDQ